MGLRKTKKFTEKLEDAYYDTTKGRPGELAVANHLIYWGAQNVHDYESDRDIQMRGIDLSYTDAWGETVFVQVKENLVIEPPVVRGAPAAEYFYIECDEDPKKHKHIKYVQADLMAHVSLPDKRLVLYHTWRMVHAEATMELQKHESHGVMIARIPVAKFDWIIDVPLRGKNG